LPSATATGASSAWTSAGTRACSSPLPHHPRAHWPLALTATQRGDVALFRDAFACAKRAGLGLTLHFAETAASASDRELETLLSFAPDRLGHVIHVSDAVKRRITAAPQPTLELCISCNVQIGLDPAVRQHRDHHFGEWWRAATNPIVLCVRFVPGAGPPPLARCAANWGAPPDGRRRRLRDVLLERVLPRRNALRPVAAAAVAARVRRRRLGVCGRGDEDAPARALPGVAAGLRFAGLVAYIT